MLHLLPNAVCSNWEGDDYLDDDSGAYKSTVDRRTLYTLYFVISLEALLIVGLAMKLAYDTWRYVRHDELPWIATKLL